MLLIQEFTLLYGDNERWCTWLSSLWSDPQVILLLEVYLWSTMFWSEDSPLIGACAGRSGGWADGGHCNYTIWKGQSTPPGSTEQAFWGTHTRRVCVCAHTFASLCVCKRESCKGKAVINYQITCVRKTEIHLWLHVSYYWGSITQIGGGEMCTSMTISVCSRSPYQF